MSDEINGRPSHELDELEKQFHAESPRSLDEEPPLEELRTSALGRRLKERRGYAISAREPKTRKLLSSWGLGGVALMAAWALIGTLPEVRYWLSSAPPIELGHLGAYQLERAQDGALAHVEGIASPKRGTYSRMFGEHELIPLIASRILIDRAREPDPSLSGFGFQYAGEGRLVRIGQDSRWSAVRDQFVDAGELARSGEIWLLQDGVVPRRGWRTPAEVGAWGSIVLLCLFFLLRRGRAWLHRAGPTA